MRLVSPCQPRHTLLPFLAMRTAWMLCLLITAALVSAAGCQRSPVPLNPVSGKVAFKGSYLPSGVIVFTPDSTRGGSGAMAFGKIGPDGSYHLYTGESLGAAAGWYRVSVTSTAPSNGQPFSTP